MCFWGSVEFTWGQSSGEASEISELGCLQVSFPSSAVEEERGWEDVTDIDGLPR